MMKFQNKNYLKLNLNQKGYDTQKYNPITELI